MMKKLFRHAIVALDLSEASDLIMEYIPHFKKFGTEKVTLVHVKPVPYSGERTEFSSDKERQIMKGYKKMLEEHGFEARFEIRSGVHYYPPTEILEEAKECGADFVVIANRGYSKVQEMLLGSTATEVLQRSPLPVYLINLELEWETEDKNVRRLKLSEQAENALNHVMHATDFSDTAFRAFEVVKELDSDGLISKVSIVHVQGHHYLALSDPASLEDLTDKNREQLDEMRNELSDKTREDAEIVITFGTPAKEIVTAAEEKKATMLIVGSQGKGFMEKFFLGGVSNQVTRLSTLPVLLVPAKRED
ncbi:MAG: universal stress protein [Balneolaceae bacterium]|nr:universal stress protein [Balneolaceae bacterium]MCH8550104.1 universal stress protein [Balneolaceae bacterium]